MDKIIKQARELNQRAFKESQESFERLKKNKFKSKLTEMDKLKSPPKIK